MGTRLRDLVIKKEISIDDLKDKKLVVDSYNMLYQFLTTIRMRDGSLLMDSKGNVTSHLVGLFSRTANMMQKGLRLAFVFDGKPPKIKEQERERRKELKEKAAMEYEIAKEREDIEGMKKYAGRTAVLTREMVEEAKKLIDALGLPIVQAPSEGEVQAASMVNSGDAYAEISQDYDCLMFGVPKLIRNLTISEKRKLPNRMAWQTVVPEMIELRENLRNLGIDQDQLITMCILMGTDYNPGGIKGIGPKTALKLVKENRDYDKLFSDSGWDKYFDFSWKEVFETIKNIKTTDEYDLKWRSFDREKVKELLCEEHDFSQARVMESLDKLEKEAGSARQKGLGDFFKR